MWSNIMKKYALFFIVLALAGCAVHPAPTATPIPMVVRTAIGDQVPQEFPTYPAIDLWDQSQWVGVDALLISKELLYEAKEDAALREQLQNVAWEMVLLISGASESDVREILQIPGWAGTTSTTREILVALRATETHVIGGGILVPKDRKYPIDIAKDVDEYVRGIQKTLMEEREKLRNQGIYP